MPYPLLALYAFVFIIARRNDSTVNNGYLGVVILLEAAVVAFHAFGSVGVVQQDRYAEHDDVVCEFVRTAREQDPYARLEILGNDNFNAPYVYGYEGVPLFASSVPAGTYKALRALSGTTDPTPNMYRFDAPNVVRDSLLNVGYYISFGKELNVPWAVKIASKDGCYLYENPYHTSSGYVVPNSMADLDFNMSQAELLNSFVYLGSGEEGVLDGEEVNMQAWDAAFSKLFGNVFQVEELQGNKVAGTVNASANGLLMTTIPYSNGWRVTVDGKQVAQTQAVEHFVSFLLDAGEHSIQMEYVPQGLVAGAVVSLLAVFGYTFVSLRLRFAAERCKNGV